MSRILTRILFIKLTLLLFVCSACGQKGPLKAPTTPKQSSSEQTSPEASAKP